MRAVEETKTLMRKLQELEGQKRGRSRSKRNGDDERKTTRKGELNEKELNASLKKYRKHIADFKDEDAKLVAEYEQELAHARALRVLLATIGEGGNLSPGALDRLKRLGDRNDTLQDATTVDPLRPALTRALVDAWSMTSLSDHSGRPEV
jgi:CRISPR-associated endonuclease/helicase Cas3